MPARRNREPIVRRKLSHEVTDRLLEDIRAGELVPGDRLPSERDLMEQFGVGRPAVREAMQSLEGMGIVEIAHGERAIVRELDARTMFDQIDRTARHLLFTSPQTLEHLKEARLLFETGMVRIAIERASDDDVKRLAACVSRLEQASGDADAFVKADLEFHVMIASMSGNPICSALSEAMLTWLVQFHQELVRVPGAEKVTIAEHRKIFKRIAARDLVGAEKAITAHLTRASKLYRRPSE